MNRNQIFFNAFCDYECSAVALRFLNIMEVTMDWNRIEGNWKSPRLLFDPAAVVESWKNELAGAGEKALAGEIERQ